MTAKQKIKQKPNRRKLRLLFRSLLIMGLTLVVMFLICFPGSQTPIAFTLATGIGVPKLQARIDHLEEKAITRQEFTEQEKRFLGDLYRSIGTGGRLTYFPRQTGKMMHHYLNGSGEKLQTQPRIYVYSRPVQHEMQLLKQQIARDMKEQSELKASYRSRVFHMADPEFFESVAGLYFGWVEATPQRMPNGELKIQWHAESTWHWPSYDFQRRQFGNYHAMCYPLPNAKSVLFRSPKYCLYLDDGLGHYLETLGIAKPFYVFAEWEENTASK